ncbi:hypothetical protein N9I13_00525 [bacterium]|nr:hypothetical protein [bacterium]
MADNNDLKTRLQLLKEIEDKNNRIGAAIKNSALNQDLLNRYLEIQKAKNKELIVKLKEVNKIRLDGLSSAESSLSSLGSMYNDIAKLEKQRITNTLKTGDLTAEQLTAFDEMASINQKIAQLGRDDIAQRAQLVDLYDDQLGKVGELNDEGQSVIDNLTQQNQLALQHSSITKKQKDFLQKQKDVYEGIKDTIGGILETASLLTSTVGGALGGALIGAGYAGKKLLDTSYQLGGSLLDTSNISTTLFGTVFEDAVGTTKSLSKEFGGLSDVSLKTQFRTNVIAKNLGIGASEAASLTGQFARLNDGSAETAQNLIQSTKNLAEQNGLVPADVMADVANSAEAFALFGKEGGTNIAEAAIAAGKLGVSMSQISGIADNLLDFESSINAELQLGAMLGKNINLDKARALAYEGDLGGMVRETLSSLGGIDEFNKMDVFAKREVANLLGVSADEFQKMAANADKLGKNGEIIPTQYEAALNNMKAFGGQLLTGVQTLGSMAVAAGQMGFSLKDGLASMKGMGGLGGKIGKIFGGGAKAAGPLTKAGAPDMRFNSNKGLGKMSKGGGMGGMMKGMGAGMKGMASGFAAFANPATLLGLAAITAGIIGIGYALRLAAPGIESLGKAIGSIVESIGNAVKTIIGGLGDFFMKVASVATPELALSVLGLAGGFYALTGSLAAFAIAGIAAIPAMLAVSAFGATSGLLDLGGDGGSSGDSDLINEIKGLRDDLISGKVGVYLDGKKVTAAVARVSNASSFNVYSN